MRRYHYPLPMTTLVTLLFTLLFMLLLSACDPNLAFIPASTNAGVPAMQTTTLTTTRPIATAIAATLTITRAVTTTAALTASTTISTHSPLTTAAATAPGSLLSAKFLETVPMTTVNTLSANFYPASNLLNARYAVDIYRLTVQSINELGKLSEVQADLFIPVVTTRTNFPVLGYAPGTTGLGDGCAPSQEYPLGRRWGDYYTHMVSYAGQGVIGVLPDGMSYQDPNRPHEYFIAELEAHTLLDAARGAYRFFQDLPNEVNARPQAALFLAGYSNGGHTAFAAKDFAADYAPELPLRGVISHGATTNVEALMRESPIFTPYLIYAYRHYFGAEVIGPEDVFLDNWLPTFDEDALSKCVDEIFVYYTNDPRGMYRPDFRTALFNGTLGDRYPLFKAVVDANYAGTFGGFDIPAAFFQGTADYVVTPASQARFAAFLCEHDEPVTYVTLPAVQHVSTRQVSFKATLAWMQAIAKGQKPKNNCAELTAAE